MLNSIAVLEVYQTSMMLKITKENGKVILECQQHIGEDTVRAISMDLLMV